MTKGDPDVHRCSLHLPVRPFVQLFAVRLPAGNGRLVPPRLLRGGPDERVRLPLTGAPRSPAASAPAGSSFGAGGDALMETNPRAGASTTELLPVTPEIAAKLVENHRRFLAFVERRVGSREAAEDILQEAFVRGLQRAGQLRDPDSVVAWFYRSLRNALVDHWRRTRSERRIFDDADDGAAEPAVDPEMMETVCECATLLLDTLKPEYAEALRRVELEGAAVKDFAAENGLTPNNASVRLFRAREALRRQFERSCGTCAEHGCLDCSCGCGA